MRKIFNKKGADTELLTSVMKLIIAAVCLVALMYLAYSLYGLFKARTHLEQARENLDQITAKMQSLKGGEEADYVLLSPKGYVLVGWPLPEDKAGVVPETCKKQGWANCLCFCEYKGITKSDIDKYPLEDIAIATSPSGALYSLISSIYHLSNFEENVLKSCNTGNFACKNSKSFLTVNSFNLPINDVQKSIDAGEGFWETLKTAIFSIEPIGNDLGKIAEHALMINVDELIPNKKPITIYFQNDNPFEPEDKYFIYIKGEAKK